MTIPFKILPNLFKQKNGNTAINQSDPTEYPDLFRGLFFDNSKEELPCEVTTTVFPSIRNWFDAMYDFIQSSLSSGNEEVAIINQGEAIGNELYHKIQPILLETMHLPEHEKIGKIAFCIKEGKITRTAFFVAQMVENTDTDFDKDLAKDGIIRMTK